MSYDLNNSNYAVNEGNESAYGAFSTSFDSKELTRRVSSVMRRVYMKMTLALVVTALTAMFTLNSSLFFTVIDHFTIFFILQIGVVILLTAALHKISSPVATLFFYLYAVLTGMVFAPICYLYTEASIAKTFFIAAGTFAAMSVYGYFTTRDLTAWGRILIFALLGLIICSVVNIFTKSSGFDWIISFFGVILFIGLTAWDTWKIKQWAQAAPAESTGKLATIGALSLYLDFINLFLYLLRFFGNRR